ncbi:MAG: translation initiation factor IF-2, partial [Thermovirgaceae bacterium]|nr:translation initiation factor IF-2 [Thermovirgaceae bacterium]
MSKIRIYELAKMLGKTNKEMMGLLRDLGVEAKNHMSSIDSATAQLVEDALSSDKKGTLKNDEPAVRISVPPGAQIADVARILGEKPGDLVKVLVSSGHMVPASSPASAEILEVLSREFGKEIIAESPEEGSIKTETPRKAKPKGDNLLERAPIITVMGHVDHGKTTLLDMIRKTNITETEAGGITQHIGASTVVHNGRRIVFLDTPGHEAFTSMRARGAQATDIVILVVAADDGVKPQTIEALNHAKASGVPIVVAVNKADKPGARPDRVRQQLSDYGLVPEEWGGDTIAVDVSALTGQGIPQLLEMVLIVADLQELKADPSISPEGVVVEARLDKGKGPIATVLVQQGSLRRGDIIQTETSWGKIRAMIDDFGKMIDVAGPSTAVEILGFSCVPQPGEIFTVVGTEKEARNCLDERQNFRRESEFGPMRRITLEEMYERMQTGETPSLPI